MDIEKVLKGSVLFRDLEQNVINSFARKARVLRVAKGEFIYQQDEISDDLYVIAKGKVELILRMDDKSLITIDNLFPNDHFGELSMLTSRPHSLSAKAASELTLIVFRRQEFIKILEANPKIHQALEFSMAERMRLNSQLKYSGKYKGKDISFYSHQATPENLATNDNVSIQHTPFHPSVSECSWGDTELAKTIRAEIRKYAQTTMPVLITGETGTGRRVTARQIHLLSDRKDEPYVELDIGEFEPWIWKDKLFGQKDDDFLLTEGRQFGIFEQLKRGTVVLCQAEQLDLQLQQLLVVLIRNKKFTNVEGKQQDFSCRLIFISNFFASDSGTVPFIDELQEILDKNHFHIPPLREHKRDISSLVNFYLNLYNRRYFKNITSISQDALGLLMNYDWPGNLTELSNVIQRAVIVSNRDEIISEQILLGLPRSEGKLLYNILRWPIIKKFFQSAIFPRLPRIITIIVFCFVLGALLLGPRDAEQNIGITLSWYVGWPLLMISFFFLPRFWCSICALAAPGRFIQTIFMPKRRAPVFIRNFSGWIMAMLCIVVLWIEIVWNAYENPFLTAGIIISIMMGSLIFSVLFQRRAWCRYVCPLGAMNAVFSMPSILELRANRQLCANRCHDYACYKGTDEVPGCPMFRHPFLVDNNRDCTLCGNCIKNCPHGSIQVNLRLAPRELWSIQSPRISDSFLVIALVAAFFFLARHQELPILLNNIGRNSGFEILSSPHISGSILFFGTILFLWSCYSLVAWIQYKYHYKNFTITLALMGYGLVPLVLGGYLAVYTRMFIAGAWRLLPNLLKIVGLEPNIEHVQLLTATGTKTLQHIIILGGFIATFYATVKIADRLYQGPDRTLSLYLLPSIFIIVLVILLLIVL